MAAGGELADYHVEMVDDSGGFVLGDLGHMSLEILAQQLLIVALEAFQHESLEPLVCTTATLERMLQVDFVSILQASLLDTEIECAITPQG